MSIALTWLGHAAWKIAVDDTVILLDPFFTGNPSCPIDAESAAADLILISHGHEDHTGDAAAIANRCGATIVSNYEIASWFARKHGVKSTIGMNLGGRVSFPWGSVKSTIAFHSSSLPDGSNGGNPGGFVIEAQGRKLYFACDTALFGDMKIIGSAGIDVAVLPIGDLFTMGPDDAIEAVKLIAPKWAIPSHFDTWPPIAQDATEWAKRVKFETEAESALLKPGETFTLP